ncbi:MAG: mechanosensitive ion channel family protein [Patescibacteria group bacterium]
MSMDTNSISIFIQETLLNSPFLEKSFFGNSVTDYLFAIAVLGVVLVVFKLFREIILYKLGKLAKNTDTDIDDMLIEIVKSLKPPFYVLLSVYISFLFIDIPSFAFKGLTYLLLIWVGYQVIIASSLVIDRLIKKKTATEEEHTQSAFRLLGNLAKGAVWIIVAMFLLSNMGVNVTSLIGALGIGGLAIALAIQNILNDLFSSFSIYFDKPFEVGDFIMVGSDMGVVEYIGVKTTRIRDLGGEELVISNQELTAARVHNYQKLSDRRIVFYFGVTYDTPKKKLETVPKIVEDIIAKEELARFDRAHFYRFDDSALTFEIVYFILSAEYNDYMDTQQSINLGIKEKMEKEGIQFAYPTRAIYMYSDKSK